MPHPLSLPRLAQRAAAVCALASLCACAQTPGSAPAGDKNLATAKQNPPGIVIFRGWGVKQDEPAQPATTAPPIPQATGAAAAMAPAGGATATAARPAASTPQSTGGLTGLLRALPPPTGKPVQEMKKLADPRQGIELPTAASRQAEKKDR